MQVNMGIVIGILTLVVVGLFLLFSKTNEQTNRMKKEKAQPEVGGLDTLYNDEIIAVRKAPSQQPPPSSSSKTSTVNNKVNNKSAKGSTQSGLLMISLMAKPNKQFVGYDLLQSLLASGLRYGDMQIFHRHQNENGQGPVLFSLASATEPGTFDVKNMGNFVGHGLTLFMRLSGSPVIDRDRFDLMYETAQKLRADLDAQLFDASRRLLNDRTVEQYRLTISQGLNTNAVA